MAAVERNSDHVFTRLAWAVLSVGMAAVFACAVAPSANVANIIYYAVSTAALGLGFVGISQRRFAGRWIAVLLFAGAAAWLSGDWLWWLRELIGHPAPFPSAIDLLCLGGYPLALVALVFLWRRHMTGVLDGLLESGILATAFGVFAWAAAIAPAGGQGRAPDLATITAIGYPALAAMLLVGLGQLLFVPSLRRARALQALTLGMALFLVSEALFVFGSVRGAYAAGTWRDGGWMLAYVLWGFAGLHPSLRALGGAQRSPIRHWALRTSLLALACLSMPAAILIAARREALDARVFFLLGSFLIVAVFLRLGLILHAQQHREEVLAETLEKLKTLIETAPVAIVAADSERRVTSWNPSAEELFGWPVEEVLDKPSPLSTSEESARNLERLFSGESFHGESERPRRDGSSVEVLVSSAPLRNEAGEVTGAVGLFLDLSERKRLEEQLRHSQRLEAVGQLAGGVAHDFNNLLTAISGYCSLALERANGDPELAQDLREIAHAAERATQLTRQLLGFGRRQVLQSTSFDLNEVVLEMSAILGRVLGEQIRIAHAPEPSGSLVTADRGQIEQVLMNLAVNARDAMPNGGTLRFVTDNVELAAWQAERLTLEPGRYARLRVSDTGCGIDPETREHVFEPFFTTKEVGKGSGLGLATVHGIVTQSGGQISLESQPGIGTSFCIYLPSGEPEASCAPVRPQYKVQAVGAKNKNDRSRRFSFAGGRNPGATLRLREDDGDRRAAPHDHG